MCAASFGEREHEGALLSRYGGTSLKVQQIAFDKYDGYQAWRQVRLSATDARGQALLIQTGSIIERDGRFKFMSFKRD